MNEKKEIKVVFPCCFCGKDDPEADVGVAFVDRNTGDFLQQWWCHEECFRSKLVPQANYRG